MKKISRVILFLFFGLLISPLEGTSITVTAPNGGESLQVGAAFQITWNASIDIEKIPFACPLVYVFFFPSILPSCLIRGKRFGCNLSLGRGRQ